MPKKEIRGFRGSLEFHSNLPFYFYHFLLDIYQNSEKMVRGELCYLLNKVLMIVIFKNDCVNNLHFRETFFVFSHLKFLTIF
jgi:hypothetical protein